MKKASKIISLLLIISVLMTSFAFAGYVGDENDTSPYRRYVSQYAEFGKKGTAKNPWNYSELNTAEWTQTANEKILQADDLTGEFSYTSYTIYMEANATIYTEPFVLEGLHGREDTPFVIKFNYNGNEYAFSENEREGTAAKILIADARPAIIIKDCSNIEIRNVDIEAPNGAGIYVYGTDTVTENITFKDVKINGIQYTDYTPAEEQTVARVANEAVISNGEAVRIDNNTKNINLKNFTITDCLNGIVVANATDSATNISNVNIVECGIRGINRDAIKLVGTNNTKILGGAITNVSTAVSDENEANRYSAAAITAKNDDNLVIDDIEISHNPDAAISLNSVQNTVVERVYSHDNGSFMNNDLKGSSNIRIRYCISGHDNLATSKILTGGVDKAYVYNNTFVDSNVLDFSSAKNSAIKNNLFSMMIMRKVIMDKGNSISNNIYHNTMINLNDIKSKIKHPQFAFGTQLNIGDYVLSKSSPLLGKGVKVEDDMGATDIYGTSLAEVTTHNIGAYEGEGIEAVDKINVNSENLRAAMAALDYWFGDTVRTIINKLIPVEVQDQLASVFGKVVEFITNLIMKD